MELAGNPRQARRRRGGARGRDDLRAKAPFDVLVVGGGPAGAAAAIYAARKGIRTGIAAERLGGQLLDTVGIENFISVKETEGHKLAAGLEQHVATYDVDVMNLQRAAGAGSGRSDRSAARGRRGAEGRRSVVIATGARWREINVPGEREYRNRGVAYCPHCDGPLFKGKRVAVIGGGNSGVEAAIDLAGLVSHVTLIEFDAQLRADAVLNAKLQSLPNVTVITRAQTTEVTGDGAAVTGLAYKDRQSGAPTHARARRRVRADRPGAEYRLAQGHGQAVAARRNRGRRARADLGARRVRRRRLHRRALQANRHCGRRGREGVLECVRSPDSLAAVRRRIGVVSTGGGTAVGSSRSLMSAAVPPHRLSSGVVVVSLVQRKLKYLLLRAYRNWDFPKGLVEAGEEPIDAALREVREETTLDDLSFDWGLEFMETGPYNKGKISRYYIARSKRPGGVAADQSGSWQAGASRGALGRF